MANFFIRRPIFAWVLAIILMMAGALAILQLPVAQYPTIAPPAVSVSANYPGADAQTVQDTVTQVIEQNMNGIDNLMYMSSTSDSAGSVTITLTFQSGTDPDIAQVQVQNKLQLATPLLPQEVQQQGISVEKSSSSYLMVAGFVSDNPGTTQDAIVSHMYIDKCTVARRTKRLEELGYISRETGKEDRRENNLYVTESGEKLVPVIREILRDWAKSVTRDLSDEERILLIALLDRLIHTDVE